MTDTLGRYGISAHIYTQNTRYMYLYVQHLYVIKQVAYVLLLYIVILYMSYTLYIYFLFVCIHGLTYKFI